MLWKWCYGLLYVIVRGFRAGDFSEVCVRVQESCEQEGSFLCSFMNVSDGSESDCGSRDYQGLAANHRPAFVSGAASSRRSDMST